jgi:hypothetical protein
VEDVPKLSDEHLAKAIELVSKHRTKKNCKSCFDRGYQGISQLNMVIPCHKCVDADAVAKEWQAHVRDTPALAEAYGDYFEAEEVQEGGEEKPQNTPEPARARSPDQHRPYGGGQPHRSVGR